MVVDTSLSKKIYCGWLKEKHFSEYDSQLKLQYFLLFYELCRLMKCKSYELSDLKAYKTGPLFNAVWNEHIKDRHKFDNDVSKSYSEHQDYIDETIAEVCAFTVKVLSEKELSSLTRKLNIWKRCEHYILEDKYPVFLSVEDFDVHDKELLEHVFLNFQNDAFKDSVVIKASDRTFVLSKKDAKDFTQEKLDLAIDYVISINTAGPILINLKNNDLVFKPILEVL